MYTADETVIELDGDIDISDISDEQFNELWEEATEEAPTVKEVVKNIKAMSNNLILAVSAARIFAQANSTTFTDVQAFSMPTLFKKWTPGEKYVLKEIVRYEVDGELYRIGQPEITASETYKPGDVGTEAIYSHIVIDEEGYEEWKEWDGVTGLYNQDQIVRDPEDGQLYKSKIPNNTYGPPHSTPDYWDLVEE